MRTVALIEALVVLLASVAAYGSPATGQSARLGMPGASTDKPISTWERTPTHPSLLGNEILRKEGSVSEPGAKPGKITPVVAVLGVKADPSCIPSTESSAAIGTATAQPSLLALCCLLTV